MPIMRPVNKPAKTKSQEGRLARHLRVAKQLREQPKSIGPLLRESMVSVWRSRGGGFYGLGYIIAFIYFEAQMLAGDVLESDSVADFAVAQVFEFVIRIGFLSFINAFMALLWPIHVFRFGGWVAVVVLIGSYYTFEMLLRPRIEAYFPELAAMRVQRELKKKLQAAKKNRRKARKPRPGNSRPPDEKPGASQ